MYAARFPFRQSAQATAGDLRALDTAATWRGWFGGQRVLMRFPSPLSKQPR